MPLPDLFKQIREHYKTHPLTVDKVDCGNVITRDLTHFFTEDPERWRKKYQRQSKYNNRGLFARNNAPYRALGEDLTHYGLDAEELVWRKLKMPTKKTTFQYVSIENLQSKFTCTNLGQHRKRGRRRKEIKFRENGKNGIRSVKIVWCITP